MKTMILILMLCVSFSAYAQWSTDPTVNTPICRATSQQAGPLIISDGAGGSIITWSDSRSYGTTEEDIYAQLINATGVVQWTTDGIAICTASKEQVRWGIISDGAGGAIITWYDYRNGTANSDIYIQRISSAGVVQWTTDGVAICTSSNNQEFPVITSDGANGAFITWQDFRNGTANSDIYSQRISATGVVQWTANGVAICTDSQNQDSPFIISDGANGAIIAWDDYRNGTTSDIYSQRISAAGVVQWTANGVAICTASNHQFGPVVTSDGVNGAIIAWTDSRSGTNADIYSQRINAEGTVQWTADGVAISTALKDQFWPAITSDGANGAIIVWQDLRNGTTRDIYSQRISASGDVQWTANGVAVCTATGDQQFPTIVGDGASGAIIAWDDLRNRNGTLTDIYSQRISAAGVVQWIANGVAICTNSNDQFRSAITNDGANGAIITWHDKRNGDSNIDIYAQHVNGDGTLGGTTGVDNDESAPTEFSLEQNYPNPFNPSTRIRFSIASRNGRGAESENVSLKVFDVLGSEMRTLVNQNLSAGSYNITFNAEGLSSGVYFYRIASGGRSLSRKLVLTK